MHQSPARSNRFRVRLIKLWRRTMCWRRFGLSLRNPKRRPERLPSGLSDGYFEPTASVVEIETFGGQVVNQRAFCWTVDLVSLFGGEAWQSAFFAPRSSIERVQTLA